MAELPRLSRETVSTPAFGGRGGVEVDLRSDQTVFEFARAIYAEEALWSADLAALDGFAGSVGEHLVRIVRHAVRPPLDTHLTEAIAFT